MKIQDGFNGKELEIRISGSKYGNAEIWITQEGLPSECERYKATLSYCSLIELLALRREIDDAMAIITGLMTE